jgi:hypothetical protein
LYTDDQDVKQIGHVKAIDDNVIAQKSGSKGSRELKYLYIYETRLADFENVRVELIHMFPLLEEIDETTVMVTGCQEFRQMVEEE